MNPKVRAAISFVNDNLHRDIYVAEVAHLTGLSRSRFSHLFKSEVGLSLIQYVKKARMEKARQILEASFASVKAVAADLGYHDPTHFEREFKKLTARHPCNIEPRILLDRERLREKAGRFASNSTFL